MFKVTSFMISHVSLGCKCFPTRATDEWFLISMDTDMNFEIRPFRKLFAASLIRASKRLRSSVQMVMGLQPALAGEVLAAVGKGALVSEGLSDHLEVLMVGISRILGFFL